MATSPTFFNVSRRVALKPALAVELSTAWSGEAAAGQQLPRPVLPRCLLGVTN
jgi:hypothetical protein